MMVIIDPDILTCENIHHGRGINPSGGVLSGIPHCLAGMHSVVEGALQLRGEADKRQVKGAKKALAHGVDGPAGQLHCVITLEN